MTVCVSTNPILYRENHYRRRRWVLYFYVRFSVICCYGFQCLTIWFPITYRNLGMTRRERRPNRDVMYDVVIRTSTTGKNLRSVQHPRKPVNNSWKDNGRGYKQSYFKHRNIDDGMWWELEELLSGIWKLTEHYLYWTLRLTAICCLHQRNINHIHRLQSLTQILTPRLPIYFQRIAKIVLMLDRSICCQYCTSVVSRFLLDQYRDKGGFYIERFSTYLDPIYILANITS